MRSDNDVEVVEGCYERQFTILLFCVETIIKGSGSRTSLPASTTMRVIRMQPACECTSMTTPPLLPTCLYFQLQVLHYCSFLQLWHPENGGNQRSEARGRRLPEPRGANTQPGLCVTLQLCFITIAKLNFRSQPVDHTRAAPSYVMPSAPSSSPG